jgi:hypothetical protein
MTDDRHLTVDHVHTHLNQIAQDVVGVLIGMIPHIRASVARTPEHKENGYRVWDADWAGHARQ